MRDASPNQGPAVRRRRVGLRVGLVCMAAAALPAGCRDGGAPVVLAVADLASPAGVGSSEPFLSSAGDTVYLSWLEAAGSGGHDLRLARLHAGAWSRPSVIASSPSFFVNWADFPSVSPGPGGSLWAHWLERTEGEGYGYGVRVTRSADRGATWATPWTPHQDDTSTEHGFVSSVVIGDALGFLWLDGRRYAPDASGNAPSEETGLYFRTAGPEGPAGPETVIDARVCDCCQTAVASTSAGPVAVYRDRSPEEIRDIRVARFRDGAWTEGGLVHADGWETAACPVNGPSIAAKGEDVAVAWFTAAGGVPSVEVAFSDDAAASFGRPAVVDGGNPAGRVDLLMLGDGSVLVSWLERTSGESAEVRVRRVERGGRMGESVRVSPAAGARASGVPQMTAASEGLVIIAWTDVTELAPRLRLARIDLRAARTGEGT